MENPAKHLVYRPNTMQLLSILTTTVEIMPKVGPALLHTTSCLLLVYVHLLDPTLHARCAYCCSWCQPGADAVSIYCVRCAGVDPAAVRVSCQRSW
jgi:hypothetical protein